MNLFKTDFTFDAGKIAEELTSRTFVPHNMKAWEENGNSALLLITTNGEENHDYEEPMLPTADLLDMPYTRSIWEQLDIPLLRSRIMRIAPHGMNQPHFDTGVWWKGKHRVHIPVQTNERCTFLCGGELVHMAAGSCWVVNTRLYKHAAFNQSDEYRTHLVIDIFDEDLNKLGENYDLAR